MADKTTAKSKKTGETAVQDQLAAAQRQLSEVQGDIRSNQRILQTLQQDPNNIDERMKVELLVRDRQIDELNAKLAKALSGKHASSENALRAKDDEIDKLNNMVKEIQQERQTAEFQVSALRTEINGLNSEVNSKSDEAEKVQVALQEEIEVIRKEVELKSRGMDDLKGDMGSLSKIIQDMTAVNNELNEKVSGQNAEMEKLNADNFSLKARAETAQELEKDLVSQNEENQKLMRTIKQQNAVVEAYKKYKTMVEDSYDMQSRSLTAIETKTRELSETQEALAPMTAQIVDVRQKLKVSMLAVIPEVQEGSADIVNQLNQAQQSLQAKVKDLRETNAENNRLKDSMTGMKSQMERAREDMKRADDRQLQRYQRLKEEHDRIKKLLAEKTDKLSAKEVEVTKSENQIAAKNSRVDSIQKRLAEYVDRVQDLETQLRDLRSTYSRCQSDKANLSREINVHQSKIQAFNTLFRTYEDDIFKRDSEVMARDSSIHTLQRQITDLKRKNERQKSAKHEQTANKLKNQLTEKTTEIKALKDAMKATQTQLKAKEHESKTFRRTIEQIKPEGQPTGSPVKKTTKALTSRLVTARNPKNQLIQLLMTFWFEAREVQRWRDVKVKKLKMTNPLGKTMSPDEIQQVLDIQLDQSQIAACDGKASAALDQVYLAKNDKLARVTIEKLSTLPQDVPVEELRTNLRYDRFQKVLPDKETISTQEICELIGQVL